MNSTETILLREKFSSNLEEYIAIGNPIYDGQEPQLYLLPGDQSKEGWESFFEGSAPAGLLSALNYLLLSDSWNDYMPETLVHAAMDNINGIEEVLSNWFHDGTELFKYIDLTVEDENNYEIVNKNNVDLNQKFIPVFMWNKLYSDLEQLKTFFKD